MRRSVAELRGPPVRELTPAGPGAAAVLVDGVPVLDEDLEAEAGGASEDDPTGKNHPKRSASAWPAAMRGPSNRGRRARLAAAAAVLSAVLLVLWAVQPAGTPLQAGGGLPLGRRQADAARAAFVQQAADLPMGGTQLDQPRPLPFDPDAQLPSERQHQQQAATLRAGQPTAGSKAASSELAVEFTAPGLRILLR